MSGWFSAVVLCGGETDVLNSLGKGTFAEVKKAVDVETGDLRAIKVG